MVEPKAMGNLLWRPALGEQALHLPPQPRLRASLATFGRRAFPAARSSALHARYRSLEPLAATSREIVEGARPRRPAIDRYESPAFKPREISSRSATVRCSGERFRPRGGSPPVRFNSRWTDFVEHPTAAAISACVCPLRIRAPTSSRSASLSLPYFPRLRITYLPAIEHPLPRCCVHRLKPPG